MRNIFPLMIAVAMTAAAPAVAQGTDNNMAAAPAADAATNTATDGVANDSAMTSNDMAATPAMDQPVETTSEPVPAKPAGFPWGVLGLLGLVGLIGRKRG